MEEEVVTAAATELIEDHPYMGHAFRYDEVEPFLRELIVAIEQVQGREQVGVDGEELRVRQLIG